MFSKKFLTFSFILLSIFSILGCGEEEMTEKNVSSPVQPVDEQSPIVNIPDNNTNNDETLPEDDIPNTNAPFIISTFPESEDAWLDIHSDLSVKFSKPMNRESVEELMSVETNDRTIDGMFLWNESSDEVLFQPMFEMLIGQEYRIVLRPGMLSEKGDILVNKDGSKFEGLFISCPASKHPNGSDSDRIRIYLDPSTSIMAEESLQGRILFRFKIIDGSGRSVRETVKVGLFTDESTIPIAEAHYVGSENRWAGFFYTTKMRNRDVTIKVGAQIHPGEDVVYSAPKRYEIYNMTLISASGPYAEALYHVADMIYEDGGKCGSPSKIQNPTLIRNVKSELLDTDTLEDELFHNCPEDCVRAGEFIVNENRTHHYGCGRSSAVYVFTTTGFIHLYRWCRWGELNKFNPYTGVKRSEWSQAVHEAGHMVGGLLHCQNNCVMNPRCTMGHYSYDNDRILWTHEEQTFFQQAGMPPNQDLSKVTGVWKEAVDTFCPSCREKMLENYGMR